MPRLKQKKEDPQLVALRMELAAGMACLGIKRPELARRAGIAYSTLTDHMINLEDMRMGEYWSILRVFKQGGYKGYEN
jgi:hypothetical protein